MIRLYSRCLPRTVPRATSVSLPSPSIRFRYATKAAPSRSATARPPIKPIPSRAPVPSRERLDPSSLRTQFKANSFYERGVRNVYTAPSHVGMLGFSWALGTTLLGYTMWLGIEGHWDVGDRMTGFQKTITEIGYRLGMFFFGFAGWYALIRYTGLVRSIDLVQRGGRAQLSLKVRRYIPILKPREIIIPTQDLDLPPYWLHQVDDLNLATGDIRRKGWNLNLGRMFWVAFIKFRAWVFKAGVIDINYTNESKTKTAMLDLSGDFSNRGSDLWELTNSSKGGP